MFPKQNCCTEQEVGELQEQGRPFGCCRRRWCHDHPQRHCRCSRSWEGQAAEDCCPCWCWQLASIHLWLIVWLSLWMEKSTPGIKEQSDPSLQLMLVKRSSKMLQDVGSAEAMITLTWKLASPRASLPWTRPAKMPTLLPNWSSEWCLVRAGTFVLSICSL